MEDTQYTFTDAEVQEIKRYMAKYPDPKSAVMPALWIAQEKFGWLSEGAMRLVAETIDMPYAQVYGVASFYTMYFKEQVPKHLIEVCTCFSCYVTGGPEIYQYVREKIGADDRGFGQEGHIWVREAECLGACDSAPMCQLTNRHYVHHLTEAKVDDLIAKLSQDEPIAYEQVPLYDQKRFQK
jgi:NADH-quinone oxidoreductase subunit E